MKIVLWLSLCLSCLCTNYTSNYNSSRVAPGHRAEAVLVPISLTSTTEQARQVPLIQRYSLNKYSLQDTNYTAQLSKLTQIQQQILYQNEPPSSVFDVKRITLQDYQLLELKQFKMVLINPTSKFRFCVNEIYAESAHVKRIEHRRLPFCLNSTTKYPFHFTLYLADHKLPVYRSSVYFIVSVYDGEKLVEEKIWPREIIVKVNQNHLRLVPLEPRNCAKNNTQVTFHNSHSYHITIMLDYEEDGAQHHKGYKEIIIPPRKNFKLNIVPHNSTITVTTRVNDYPDIVLVKLYLPAKCLLPSPLAIHHFPMGILNSERSIMEVPIPVSNHLSESILVHEIYVESSSQTVELLPAQDGKERIQPNARHAFVCRLFVHPNKYLTERTQVKVRIKYWVKSDRETMLEVTGKYMFLQWRNPVSLGTKRFIDVTKLSDADHDSIPENTFAIRNNLNIPLLLIRVLHDDKNFKLLWQQDKRNFLFPTQVRQEFSLRYIGPRNLTISPTKFLITLEFNGYLLMPVQIIVFDHSLQCEYNSVHQKCSDLMSIDFGYFRNYQTRSKQLVVKNQNPIPKDLLLNFNTQTINQFGMNCSVRIYGPFPNYDNSEQLAANNISFHLKSNHFLVLMFALKPFINATTGNTSLTIITENEHIDKKVKFKFENGTIAVLPQIIRIHSAYEKSVEYLNLVSTYSESYKIKSTVSNVSNLDLFYNNYTEIQENQWVGLALMYTPFTRINLTETCCGNDYAITLYITSLYVFEFKRFTYAGVKITTTNDLEVNATVIIDNKPPKLIQQQTIEINLIQANKPDRYELSFQNFFSEPMKLRLVMVPTYLYQNAKLYMSTMRKARKIQEQFVFCANSRIQQKHNFSPQLLKTIFSLDMPVNQITIELLDNDEYYIRGKGKNYQRSASDLSTYMRRMTLQNISNCYEMQASKYVKQLIEVEILNQIAEKHGNEILLEFVEREMEYFNSPTHFLFYDEFYDLLRVDLEGYCERSTFPLFRFCKHVNIVVSPAEEVVIHPNQTLVINMGIVDSATIEPEYQFYLAILNNITKYETHEVIVQVSEPKLSISEVYLEDSLVSKEEFEEHYFKESDWNGVLRAEGEELLRERARVLPIFVSTADIVNGSFVGERLFTVSNTGTVKLEVSHVGFSNIEKICSYQGVEVIGEVCTEGFDLEPGEEKQLGIRFRFSHHENTNHILTRKIYLYNQENYYFRMTAAIRFSDPNKRFISYRKSINSLFLNIISFMFLIYVIWNLKKESDLKRKQSNSKIKMKSRILSTRDYPQLGTKMEKKQRKLQQISMQQITAVKEQKKLKQFFNSSGESDIITKNQNEEESSSNQIIYEKQQKVNASISEDSSLQFQFHGINREKIMEEIENDMLDFGTSDFVSEFPSVVYDGSGNMDFTIGWDDEKKENTEDKDFYNPFFSQNPLAKKDKDFYNPFFSQNPLTKKNEEEKKESYAWIQDFKKNH